MWLHDQKWLRSNSVQKITYLYLKDGKLVPLVSIPVKYGESVSEAKVRGIVTVIEILNRQNEEGNNDIKGNNP